MVVSSMPYHNVPIRFARPWRFHRKNEVDIYGKKSAHVSMIIHKLIASSTAYPKLFILSPKFRIEKLNEQIRKHVYEFTQLDFEAKTQLPKYNQPVEEAFVAWCQCEKNCKR